MTTTTRTMLDQQLKRARLVSSIAATVISLACGTNYVYSAWAPQFADKLHLTTTQSNLIGLAGNLGMYSMGVPVGMYVDRRGTRPPVILGALLLGLGYFPFKAAYESGTGSVPLLCIFSFLTGFGSCMAFAASVKTSALNWPHHRGTATAFPLAAFGLSAFFFSASGSVFFPGNTGAFLMFLSVGTFTLTFLGFFFLKVYPRSSYHPIHSGPGLSSSQQLRRTLSEESKPQTGRSFVDGEPGMSPTVYTTPSGTTAPALSGATDELVGPSSSRDVSPPRRSNDVEAASAGTAQEDIDETSSLVSRSSSLPGDVYVESSVDMDRSHRIDIRGWALLKSLEFWQLFCIMAILAGIGLMTINNIGHDVNALWKYYDKTVDDTFLVHRQQMHVSILSIGSFIGRLLSGVGSDFLVKVLKASRVWCLALGSVIFFIAQLCALNILNPHLLGFVSGLSGLGYGFLFGVFPSIVAESFGIHGLSQNWGFMTLSPVVSGNVFNLFYGKVFDKHSIVNDEGERTCPDGIDCYKDAYYMTLGACAIGLCVSLWTIRRQHHQRLKEAKRTAED
ncbi:MFS general substrate transporter [Neurospora crassa]|uniref:MFS transporter n=1 Tax=Neurospora crassa (strain ATCC 24698 / 74-OR23-1A / CBS 708.71 / DSM 1257 / FGSC 987) TaxID=367110 RepID=Q7SAQ4_NEUCR|nr:MFS transporter [Neurospora crassa OR74A]EAA33419.3 MFS transporter [Neurospora crassa OR74A]KHE84454.1 MFS general substrate transporter [Neurospora crassa]|eukprot:XP_962655.3 MFS transporter [Neurospora crassa OR74A]